MGRVPLRRESNRDGDGPHVSDGGLGHARTIRSLSPEQANTALVLLQVLMATISITALTVAVLVWERRRADHAQARLAAIVESSADAIISTTVDGVITSWNRAAERLYGWSPAEAIGRHITLIVPEDRRTEEDEILRRARRGEPIDSLETVRVAKDGRSIDLFLTVSPVKDSIGRIVGVFQDRQRHRRTQARGCRARATSTGGAPSAGAAAHGGRVDVGRRHAMQP